MFNDAFGSLLVIALALVIYFLPYIAACEKKKAKPQGDRRDQPLARLDGAGPDFCSGLGLDPRPANHGHLGVQLVEGDPSEHYRRTLVQTAATH
jgi:hypothetical protein